MAIQNKKIPTPSEIKSSPQTFSSNEISELKKLREEITNLAASFGQLYINKIKLEEQETLLKNKMNSLETQEKQIAENLTKKYGKGSIDLETGTFTPIS
jgi:predicted  nucleic acid-binding Zn-ribbon protein